MPTKRWIEASNILPALSVAALALAALYSLAAPPPATPLDAVVGVKKTVLGGVITADPDRREKVALVTVRIDMLNGSDMIYHARPKVLVSVDPHASVEYGDRITAEGVLKYPETFETDAGRLFDYPRYLRAHGIRYTMSFANVSVLKRGEGNALVARLLYVKHTLERGIASALPAPESSLLAGLLVGDKRSLGEEITEAFRAAGVIHIIVLSGYNVSLVLNSVVFLVSRLLPRIMTYLVAGVFVIGFAVMTGGSETTIRAVIMALIMMVATVMRRPKAALRALLIAASAMALWNPFVVLYDLSFQLSVLATLGLIVFSDRIAAHLPFISKSLGLREIVATTLATQITVLPLLILSVGQVSLVFLATNPLILPAVPLAMLAGFIAALVALISPVLALPLSSIAYLVLTYIVQVGVRFGSLPFSSVAVPPEWSAVILPLLGLLYLAVFIRFRMPAPNRVAREAGE